VVLLKVGPSLHGPVLRLEVTLLQSVSGVVNLVLLRVYGLRLEQVNVQVVDSFLGVQATSRARRAAALSHKDFPLSQHPLVPLLRHVVAPFISLEGGEIMSVALLPS
jgi:hypothetical protein